MLYLLYTLVAALFFLILLFPAESVKKGIKDRIERMYPPYQIRIGDLRPILPPGLQITGLILMENDESRITISKLNLIPKLLRLISGQLSFQFDGEANEGKFSGELDCIKGDWLHAERLSLTVTNLKIKEAALKAIEGDPVISGIINGSLTFSQAGKSGEISDAALSLKEATLSLPALSAEMAGIAFEKVDAAFSIEKQTITFRQFVFTGPQLEGAITGTVRLAEPVATSHLNLRMEISIRPESQEKLAQLIPLVLLPNRNSNQNSYKLRIFGMLDKPGFSIAR